MKKVRVDVEAILEVYIEDNVSDDEAKRMANEIAIEQIKHLDESESGIRDPDLYLANYATLVIDCEEEDCE